MIKLDKNFEKLILEENFEKIKFFFYKAGCSELKLGVEINNFLIDKNLKKIGIIGNTNIFIEKEYEKIFENSIITRTIKSDHTGEKKVRYIFSNENEVKRRCGCGSSFSFKKREPKLDITNLKNLKNKFNKIK